MRTTIARSNLVRPLARALGAAALLSLGACASFDGQPEPVLSTENVVGSATINVQQALRNFYSTDARRRDGLSPEGYRNMIVGTHMMAADARYTDFRRGLARESKGSFFGLDLAVLGLSGGASVAGERTANLLSAGAAALTGTRATLSKDVYFDRTLPALFAGMDAARTKVRTNIMLKLTQSAQDYPLPVALADLAAYEGAGSLDRAIENITANAVEASRREQWEYEAKVLEFTGAPEPGVVDARRPIGQLIRRLRVANDATSLSTLQRIASAIGVDPGATADSAADAILTKMDGVLTVAGTKQLAATIQTAAEQPQPAAPQPELEEGEDENG